MVMLETVRAEIAVSESSDIFREEIRKQDFISRTRGGIGRSSGVTRTLVVRYSHWTVVAQARSAFVLQAIARKTDPPVAEWPAPSVYAAVMAAKRALTLGGWLVWLLAFRSSRSRRTSERSAIRRALAGVVQLRIKASSFALQIPALINARCWQFRPADQIGTFLSAQSCFAASQRSGFWTCSVECR